MKKKLSPRGRKEGSRALYDPEKEVLIKQLVQLLTSHGYQIRREKLKMGVGWRAVSGLCRMYGDNLIFVDRKLSQEDQVAFLILTVVQKNLTLSAEEISAFPKKIQSQFQALLMTPIVNEVKEVMDSESSISA